MVPYSNEMSEQAYESEVDQGPWPGFGILNKTLTWKIDALQIDLWMPTDPLSNVWVSKLELRCSFLDLGAHRFCTRERPDDRQHEASFFEVRHRSAELQCSSQGVKDHE